MCGEKVRFVMRPSTLTGSPPRVRGKAAVGAVLAFVIGITPACAGKRKNPLPVIYLGWDHPRVCGEKRRKTGPVCGILGSPPRVRGKVDMGIEEAEVVGITPACAGKSRCRRRAGRRPWDHPRVCGEKTLAVQSSVEDQGSPPRVRGKGTRRFP